MFSRGCFFELALFSRPVYIVFRLIKWAVVRVKEVGAFPQFVPTSSLI